MSLRALAIGIASVLSTAIYLTALHGLHIIAAVLVGLLVFAIGVFVFAIKEDL